MINLYIDREIKSVVDSLIYSPLDTEINRSIYPKNEGVITFSIQFIPDGGIPPIL